MAYGILDTIAPNPWDYGQWGDVSNKSSSVQDYYTKYLGNGGYQAQESAFRIPQPGVPRYGTLPEAPAVPGAAPQMAQIPNILAQQGGGDGAYNLGGQPGATSAGSLSDMLGGASTSVNNVLGSFTNGLNDLMDMGYTEDMTPDQRSAQTRDIAEKAGNWTGLVASTPIGLANMAFGQYNRAAANAAYPNQPAIGFFDDILSLDAFNRGGSPQDQQAALAQTLSHAAAGGLLSADDKATISDFYGYMGQNIDAEDIDVYGNVVGKGNILDALGMPATGRMRNPGPIALSQANAQAAQAAQVGNDYGFTAGKNGELGSYNTFGGWMDALEHAIDTGWYGDPTQNPHDQMGKDARDKSAQQAIADQLAAEQAAANRAAQQAAAAANGWSPSTFSGGWDSWGGMDNSNSMSDSSGGVGTGSANDASSNSGYAG